MYSRDQGDESYTFEASGGLLHAGLVMRDRETDSWWSIITEEAIHGPAAGERLELVPGSVKTVWGEWRREHPHSKVLSVDGVEHREESPYDRYFASEEGFRSLRAADDRLTDKAEIYSFHHGGRPHAVPHSAFDDGGAVLPLGDRELFLYRLGDDSFYRSTVAYLADGGASFSRGEEGWRLTAGEEAWSFEPDSRTFETGAPAERYTGFDTFWYIWSLSNPETEVLGD